MVAQAGSTVAHAVRRAAQALNLGGRRVLVAVSGGVDSTVLLHVLALEADRLGLGVVAGHVNHGLRGAESDADQLAVRHLAGALQVPLQVAHVDPEALHKLAGAAGADRIATAHTLDDQAETVLLRLLRGTGVDGLGGIPESTRDGRVVRPLLSVRRQAIEHYAREKCLSWREDPSNLNPRYARGRLRSGGLAELAATINPAWLRALGDLAEAQRRDAEWLEQLVDDAWQELFRDAGDDLAIAAAGWSELPEGLARRLVRRALRRQGGARDVSRVHLLRTLDFLRGAQRGTRLELPGDLELHCTREGFLLRRLGVR
jgi:tRNA(Ile)-lysidine synthase